jgi:hypothetical protein
VLTFEAQDVIVEECDFREGVVAPWRAEVFQSRRPADVHAALDRTFKARFADDDVARSALGLRANHGHSFP